MPKITVNTKNMIKMSSEINFKDYLLINEKWLGSENDGSHEPNGVLDSSEISIFFSSSHLNIKNGCNNETSLTEDGFNNWYSSNESSISSYFDSLGLEYNDDNKIELLNSMLEFIDEIKNEDPETYEYIPSTLSTTGTRTTQINLAENENLSRLGNFQNKYVNSKKAEEVNADLFDGPVVTLSKYDQERIIKSGFIDDIEGYTTTESADCFSRVNSDGVREFLRVVNDNGNYKIIHTAVGDNVNNTEVFSLNRKDISNFEMPENFQGSNKNDVKYDNLGNYHISATSGMNTIANIIKNVYGVDVESEEGQKIYEAIVNKNTLLNIESSLNTIETGKDIILVDKKELDAIEKAKSAGNLFNANINIKSQYVNNGDTIPYLLLGPENPDPNVEYPVIVYLHGDGQKGKDESSMYKIHSPGGFMQDLDLDNFNGYVLCPQLTGAYYQDGWDRPASEQYVRDLINNFSQNYNIDSDRIALTGASRGGMGTIYLASKMEDVFCSAAALSGYPTGVQPKDINIPIRGYVGTLASNESPGSVTYMNNTFAAQLGAESLISVNADHTHVPQVVFGQDLDGDHCSDLIQWLFKDSGGRSSVTPSYFQQSEPIQPKNLISIDRTPTPLNGDIRNTNWEEYGYNPETGQKFAQSAKDVESRLISKGISTQANCLGGVKDTFIEVTGESPFGLPGQGTRVAADCAGIMENLDGYREITGISVYELQYLPAGAIVVWSSSTTGDNPADKYGHISISLGNGQESSTKVITQYTSVGKNGKPRVFIPVG